MGFEILRYTPEMSDACLRLERDCAQGKTFKMWFDRSAFHRRSESYDHWSIWVCREGNRILGTSAWAEKSVLVRGRPERSAFLYDLRVHPEARRRGIAKGMKTEVFREIAERGMESSYSFSLAGTFVPGALARELKGRAHPAYTYWVWPVYRKLGASSKAVIELNDPRSVHDAHEKMRRSGEPWDFYCDPFLGGKMQGYTGSMSLDESSCSLWSNAGILEEVIEGVPWGMRMAAEAASLWPLNRWAWPHIPKTGEKLKSELVFDFSWDAGSALPTKSARELAIALNDRAFDRGIQFLYFAIPTFQKSAFRPLADLVPSWASPWLDYHLIYQSKEDTGELQRVYCDIRDA